ncbi:MAG: 4'-phosphopantetheinyl transferase superfamily protein [Bacillota bacterium]|nr:4'-phosphopantetheinyl transferase superfamily protein [Bacillota bacterium]
MTLRPGSFPVAIFVPPPDCALSSEALLRLSAEAYAPGQKDCFDELCRSETGKPRFPQAPGVHFSVTHSGGQWLAAFSEAPVGLDLQIHRSCAIEALSRRFFHPAETAWLEARGFAPESFFDLWAAKESYVKFTGRGIAGGLDGFSVVNEKGFLSAVDGTALRFLPWEPGWSLCLSSSPGPVDFFPLNV